MAKSKIFSTVFLLVGTMIGAGFISGQELLVYFGGDSRYFLVAVLVCFLCNAFCLSGFFLLIKKYNIKVEDLGKIAFKKASKIFYFLLYFCYFILVCAMLSGLFELYNIAWYTKIVFIFFTMYLVSFGIRGLEIINFLLVPIMIIFVILLSVLTLKDAEFVDFSAKSSLVVVIAKVLLYTFSNLFSSVFILAKLPEKHSKKSLKICSFIFAFIMAICILGLTLSLFANYSSVKFLSIPNLFLAKKQGNFFFVLFKITVFFAIFTTLISAVYPFTNITKKHKLAQYFLFSIAFFLFSQFGFSQIVGYFYPLMGVFGIIFFVGFFKNVSKYYANMQNFASKVGGKSIQDNRLVRNSFAFKQRNGDNLQK